MVRWWAIPMLALSGIAGGSATGGPGAPPRRVVVRMTDANRFEPRQITLSAGDTVEWVNVGQMPHTATDQPGTAGVPGHNVLPRGATPWDSGLLQTNLRFRVVLRVAGEYAYLCMIHEASGMFASITVRPRAP